MTPCLIILAVSAVVGVAVYFASGWWMERMESAPIADAPTDVPEWRIASDAYQREGQFAARFEDMLHERSKSIASSHGRMTVLLCDVESAGAEMLAVPDVDAMLPPRGDR